MRHVELKFLFVQSLVKAGRIMIGKVRTDSNIADLGTKALNAPRLEYLKRLAGKGPALPDDFGASAATQAKSF